MPRATLTSDGAAKRRGRLAAPAALAAALTALAAAPVPGCATSGTFRDGRYTSREATYVVGDLADGWRYTGTSPGDVAFANDRWDATIYVDNSCRRYTDASLHTLASHLFYGFDDVEVLEQSTFELDGREALRRVAAARLDGVRVRLGITILKRDHCIFDLVVIASPTSFPDAYEDYEGLVRGFSVEACE